jgi:glycerol uptake facilitator protein
MSKLLAELLGTMILIILGDGVVAMLNKSKGQNSGWIVITTGWGLAATGQLPCLLWACLL